MRFGTAIAVLSLCAAAGCQFADSMPWSSARFNTREWMLARQHGAVTVEGPENPKLLWKWDEPGFDVLGVQPMPDGTTFICGSKDRENGVQPKESEDFTKEDFKKLFREAMARDGGSDGYVIKLDRDGKELKRLKLPDTADKKGWSDFSFTAYPSYGGYIATASKRVYADKMKEYNKIWTTPFDQMDSLDFEKLSMVGSRVTRLAAWDLDLNLLWTKDMADVELPSGIAMDSRGRLVLDTNAISKEPMKVDAAISWLNREGEEVSRFDIKVEDHDDVMDLWGAGRAGNNGRRFAESQNGFLFARGGDQIICFDAKGLYQKVVRLKREILSQPAPRPDGGHLVMVVKDRITGDSKVDRANKQKDDADHLRKLTAFGDDAGSLDLKDWDRGSGVYVIGNDGSLYFVTVESKVPEDKKRVLKRLRDGDISTAKNHEISSSHGHTSWNLKWTAVVGLHKVSPSGLQEWVFKYEIPTSNLGPMYDYPIVDERGHSYLAVEDKLIGIDELGNKKFILDLEPHQVNTSLLLFNRDFQIDPSGRIYLMSDSEPADTVFVFND